MKTLKISDSKALELYKTASSELKEILEETFGLDFFKAKDITEKVNNLKSLFEYLKMKEYELLPYPNAKSNFERYLNACVLIPEIVKIYNNGKELDWYNTNEYKYLPYIKKVGSTWVAVVANFCGSSADGPFAHHYKTRELALKGLQNFNQIYLDYLTYKG
jgi:hypothetical protein